jgi:voltage-gated potassium channel
MTMPKRLHPPASDHSHHHTNLSATYHLVMLAISLYAIAALAAGIAIRDPQIRLVLDYADYAVCILFASDFMLSLWRAPNRRKYLMTWGWLDLISSIPFFSVARWGRLARIARVFRVLRGVRATQEVAAVLLKKRAGNTFLAAALLALLLVIVCSIAELHFETTPSANIRTAEDAVWWAFSTVTTVGCGDRYPVTSEGRFVAVILMCAGVGLFGTLSGLFAAWFLGNTGRKDADFSELRNEITSLRELIEQRL